MSQLSTNSYKTCVYDNHCFFGTILSKHDEDIDVNLKCMYPFWPAPSSFHLSAGKEDIYFVPFCNTRTPLPLTRIARQHPLAGAVSLVAYACQVLFDPCEY